MIILSINYKLIVSTNLRQAMQHAKTFHRKSKDNIKNSTKKNFLKNLFLNRELFCFTWKKYPNTKQQIHSLLVKFHIVYIPWLWLKKKYNVCKLPVKWIKYQFYNYGFSNSSVNIWLFRDFNCMIRSQLIKDLKELC